jgi:hypothetical protein
MAGFDNPLMESIGHVHDTAIMETDLSGKTKKASLKATIRAGVYVGGPHETEKCFLLGVSQNSVSGVSWWAHLSPEEATALMLRPAQYVSASKSGAFDD